MNTMNNAQTLIKAVGAGRVRQVRLLLGLGVSTEEQDGAGQTPLIKANFVEHDRARTKLFKLLLNHGAQVSRSDIVGRNALMWACLFGRDADIALLLQYEDVDLNYNLADINGQTALFHAVTSGNAASVKLMVSALGKYSLTTDSSDHDGHTPLMQAQLLGHDICESILIFEGNAKIGLRKSNVESKHGKWTVSSLRHRPKLKVKRGRNSGPSQFPPISNGKIHNDNDITECRNKLLNICINQFFESDGESSASEDDLMNTKTIQAKTKTSPLDITNGNSIPILPLTKCALNSFQEMSRCSNPTPSLASTSATPGSSSTAGNLLSSDDESEVDSVASTITDAKLTRPCMDVTSIYAIKQDEMSSSYRKAAVKAEEPLIPDTEITHPQPSKPKGKYFEAHKWKQLRRGLLLNGHVSKMGKVSLTGEADVHPQSTGKGVAVPLHVTCKRGSTLPNIFHEHPPANNRANQPLNFLNIENKKILDSPKTSLMGIKKENSIKTRNIGEM